MFNLKNLPKSPINESAEVELVESFSVAEIVRLYHQQENLDVRESFRGNDEFYLLRCQDTDYRFYYPFEIIGDEKFYKNLQNSRNSRGIDYDRDWEDDHKFAFDLINSGEKVLEIGCNTGKFLERIREKTDKLTGLELNGDAAQTAIRKGFDVKKMLIEAHAEENAETYDVVCAFQVLEHVTQVKSFLDSAVKVLKPAGKLIFSVPNNEPYFQRFSKYEVLNLPPHHLGLWNLDVFRKMTNFYNIELRDYKLLNYSNLMIDAYLRAKLTMGVKSPYGHFSLSEKIKIFAALPFTAAAGSLDYLRGNKNYAFLSVLFVKT